jgi:putative transposase
VPLISGRVCRSTVINVLKENGLDPGPQRGEGSWDEFLKIHAKTLWACDFLSKKVWTKWGLAEFYILFFIHVGSRRVYVSGMTTHPDTAWVAQQAKDFSIHLAEQGQEASRPLACENAVSSFGCVRPDAGPAQNCKRAAALLYYRVA